MVTGLRSGFWTLTGVATIILVMSLAAAAGTPEWTDVRTYGAVCNGSDAAPAFQAAINAAPSGGTVYAPPCSWLLLSALTINGKSLTLVGDGQASTLLIWTSSAPMRGVTFAATDINHRFTLRGVGLLTQAQGGTALTLTWPWAASVYAPSPCG